MTQGYTYKILRIEFSTCDDNSSVRQSVSLSVCQSVSLSVCQSVSLSVCHSVFPSVRHSVFPSVRRLVGPSVRLSVCPSVRLSVYEHYHFAYHAICYYIRHITPPIGIGMSSNAPVTPWETKPCCAFTRSRRPSVEFSLGARVPVDHV